MQSTNNLYQLPENLPVPVDDGACNHLVGMRLPSVSLIATSGRVVNVSHLMGSVVVYCYPRMGQPGMEPSKGWDEIPGARGCTSQACAFRDHYHELQTLGAQVFGLSTQETEYQREAVERLHLPFELLSDWALEFATQLHLPTFQVDAMTRMRVCSRLARRASYIYQLFKLTR